MTSTFLPLICQARIRLPPGCTLGNLLSSDMVKLLSEIFPYRWHACHDDAQLSWAIRITIRTCCSLLTGYIRFRPEAPLMSHFQVPLKQGESTEPQLLAPFQANITPTTSPFGQSRACPCSWSNHPTALKTLLIWEDKGGQDTEQCRPHRNTRTGTTRLCPRRLIAQRLGSRITRPTPPVVPSALAAPAATINSPTNLSRNH